MPDSARQQATVVSQRNDVRLHQYALAVASPAYRSAFEKVMQYPESYHSQLTPEEAFATTYRHEHHGGQRRLRDSFPSRPNRYQHDDRNTEPVPCHQPC